MRLITEIVERTTETVERKVDGVFCSHQNVQLLARATFKCYFEVKLLIGTGELHVDHLGDRNQASAGVGIQMWRSRGTTFKDLFEIFGKDRNIYYSQSQGVPIYHG